MKTPRDLLLKKHAAAEPKLEAISRKIVEQCAPERAAETKPPWRWTDWFWPSPVAWGAVAAAWLLVIGFNVASADLEPKPIIVAKHSPETLEALREQRRLLVELTAPPVLEADAIRPRPRSEATQPFAMA